MDKTDKSIPESKHRIPPSEMDMIRLLDKEQQAILLGEDPHAQPAPDLFEKALREEMKLAGKTITNGGFLEVCCEYDMTFKQGWIVFQRLSNER